ncbi:MAG: hypothetical protein QXN37_00485 [Candidatus Anstonellaceae archaeon]
MLLLDEGRIALIASLIAFCGIAVLFIFMERATEVSVPQALLEKENTLVRLQGEVENVTSNGFSICSDGVCIKVNAKKEPLSFLIRKGSQVEVTGKVKIYQMTRYIEAERIKIM